MLTNKRAYEIAPKELDRSEIDKVVKIANNAWPEIKADKLNITKEELNALIEVMVIQQFHNMMVEKARALAEKLYNCQVQGKETIGSLAFALKLCTATPEAKKDAERLGIKL